MRVFYLTTELKPFVQSGGVADVASRLPAELRRLGVEIEIALPLYSSINLGDRVCRDSGTFVCDYAGRPERVSLLTTHLEQVPVTLIGNETYFSGEYGRPYVHSPAIPFYDDVLRFCFFSEACLPLIAEKHPDIVHVNDWPLGFLFGRMVQEGLPQKRVLTVHNIGYQGNIGLDAIRGQPPEELCSDPRLEPLFRDPRPHWHSLNPLRLGLETAHMANTVSPTFCQEITMPDEPERLFLGGQGLEAVTGRLRQQGRLTGVLNGFDGPAQSGGFEETLDRKRRLKKELCQGFAAPDGFLLGLVGRASEQKCRLLMEPVRGQPLLAALLDLPGLNLAAVSTGEARYEEFLDAFRNRPNVSLSLRFDPELAEQISSGCDLFLMPSLFEPCGLAQLASMSRGTPPLVRAIGGLADTVRDQQQPGGTGFCFDGHSRSELLENCLQAVQRAAWLWARQPEAYQQVQHNGFSASFPWRESAQAYLDRVYEPARHFGWPALNEYR